MRASAIIELRVKLSLLELLGIKLQGNLRDLLPCAPYRWGKNKSSIQA